VIHEKLRDAFMQGEEREAANLFRQVLRQAVRAGLYEAMAEEVEALCGPRYRPDHQSACHRAGSEKGVAYLDGGKEEIRRPRVRHETDGEVRLATYEAASSPQGLFEQVVAVVAQGLPPHQDFPLIQGTAKTWTCWIPLGDCPRAMGGLTMLKGSHRHGYLPIQPSKGAGGIAVPLCPWETEWVEGDYEAGDIITFPSYTIHKALRCQDKELIRVSLDVRYQSVDEPVEQKSLLPHCDLTWEEIYAGWGSDELKYYWEKVPLSIVPWEDSYMQPSTRIC